jgi:hypothetical protein
VLISVLRKGSELVAIRPAKKFLRVRTGEVLEAFSLGLGFCLFYDSTNDQMNYIIYSKCFREAIRFQTKQ